MSETTTPSGPRRAVPTKRRRALPIVLISLAVVLVAAVAIAAIFAFKVNSALTKNINRDDSLPGDSSSTPGASGEPSSNTKGQLNYLLLGSDSRNPEDEGAGRSDSIMLVHLNKQRNHAYIISFPRDMYVEIPGHGKNKINAAYSYGGAKLTGATLESLTGVHINHTVQIDFTGFIELTNDLGGVTVTNKTAFKSHGYSYPKGKITIKGQQALWFVRERHSLPRGDFDRAENQRNVIKAIVQKGLSTETLADPVKFTAFIGNVAKHLTVDSTLTDSVIRDTALSLRLTSKNISLLQAPISGTGTSPDGQSIDIVDEAKLAELNKALGDDTMDAYVKKYPEG